MREQRHGPNSEGEQRHGHNSGEKDQHGRGRVGAGVEGDAVGGVSGETAEPHNNEGLEKHLDSLGFSRHGVGVKFLVFFDIRIEEEDLHGMIEFGLLWT